MSSEPSPAFLFYVKDWRSSRKVQGMNFAGRGMYLEMLLEQWESGSVPASPSELASLLGGTKAEWTRAWPKLSACFVARTRDGRLVNAKLEGVRRDRLKYKKAQAESGLRGAQKRWKNHGKPIGSPSGRHESPMAKNGSSSSSSFASAFADTPPPPDGEVALDVTGTQLQAQSENGAGLRERFDAFWKVYPRKVGRDAAWRAWQKRRPGADLTGQICAALAWQRQQDNWLRDGGRFIPNPSTWIHQGRWQDEPSTTPRLSDRTLAIGRAGEEFLKS